MNGKAPEPSSRDKQIFKELYTSRYLNHEQFRRINPGEEQPDDDPTDEDKRDQCE